MFDLIRDPWIEQEQLLLLNPLECKQRIPSAAAAMNVLILKGLFKYEYLKTPNTTKMRKRKQKKWRFVVLNNNINIE